MTHSDKGFTLIEILIALTVFAILATITSTVLYNSFSTRTRVNQQADKLAAIQLAMSHIEQDTRQAIRRPVYSDDMMPIGAFIGQHQYLEFTRAGGVNPQYQELKSPLTRVAYRCTEGKLIRRTWPNLDTPNRKLHHDTLLLNHLKDCHFNYLNQNLQLLEVWREQALTQNQKQESLPKAIQVTLTMKAWGEMKLYFVIPGALYGQN